MVKGLSNIASGLSNLTIGLIIALAVVTIGGFVYVVTEINKIDKNIAAKNKSGRRRRLVGKGFQREPDTITWENTLDSLEEFNKVHVIYSVFAQLISVFPLLGILGTVSGLMGSFAGDSTNIELISRGLGEALVTTFLGLIAAIVLKIFDAVFVSKKINEMELYFETFEQDYEMAKDKSLLGNSASETGEHEDKE